MRSLWLAMLLGSAALAADGGKRPTDEVRGKELYDRHCLACHGATAAGDGPATTALVAEVPNLQGAVKDDKAAIELVRFGRGAMPAFEASFDAEDARRVLKYMAQVHTAAEKPATRPADPAPAPEAEAPLPDGAEVPEGPAVPE